MDKYAFHSSVMFEKHLIIPSHLETFPLGVLVLGGTFKGGAVPLAHPRLHHFSLKIGTMRSRQPSNLRNGPSVMKIQVYPMKIHSKSSKTIKEATELTFQIRNCSITRNQDTALHVEFAMSKALCLGHF